MPALERDAVDLAPFPRRERARRRRIAVLALGVLARPTRATELRGPFAEDMEEALLEERRARETAEMLVEKLETQLANISKK